MLLLPRVLSPSRKKKTGKKQEQEQQQQEEEDGAAPAGILSATWWSPEMAANLRTPPQQPLRLLFVSTSAKPPTSVKLHYRNKPTGVRRLGHPGRAGVLPLRCRSSRSFGIRCWRSQDGAQAAEVVERPPFDLNLAVVLAGFAFEAYTSPPTNVGRREIDAADCQTVFLSESFLREVYDGQLFIKLKKGSNLPAMDPWGTSDPYVIMNLEGQVAKSNVKWGTKEPTWNEDFTLNIRKYPANVLQIAAWDANLVTPHKRMGNAGIELQSLCDASFHGSLPQIKWDSGYKVIESIGNVHELVVQLEGIGGGGKIHLEVKYKSFDEIDKEKQWWNIPFVSDFLVKSNLGSALKMAFGSESINARQFVQSAFGQLNFLNDAQLQKDQAFDSVSTETLDSERCSDGEIIAGSEQLLMHRNSHSLKDDHLQELECDNTVSDSSTESKADNSSQSDGFFWKIFSGTINQNVLQSLGFTLPENVGWDGFDLLNRMSLQSQRSAEQEYIESGLATPERNGDGEINCEKSSSPNEIPSTLMDIRKTSWNVLSQTETILGALMVLTATFSQQGKIMSTMEGNKVQKDDPSREAEKINSPSVNGTGNMTLEGSTLDKGRAEEIKALFSTAETAMEAWAMLATSLGRPSFIKSEFEKICFLDNASTDTQASFLLLPSGVIQQGEDWLLPSEGLSKCGKMERPTDRFDACSFRVRRLNPERIGGDFKQEVQACVSPRVHSGFLSAYDSVRNRIMTLIKLSIGFSEDADLESIMKWHIYVTGHSLGGALATLLALELSSSRMAKSGAISVTMYNFGSPRVGNKCFAEVYNEKVKDSWRIVNHRDIIPTVPRLMGYCHVAQPVYLAAGDLKIALVNLEPLRDEYQGDVIGEATPDVLVTEFMRGEKQLVEKILQTEINLFRSLRDGTALMQHMEDFYYITLLEVFFCNFSFLSLCYKLDIVDSLI
ncbi:hypothetical protein Taro_051986 [Colocasia esculenta]|uniref:C2 domain-containing protein n=1 Tax=Colocasia esculenta TaxID=4460 RepID=A0A843XID2_COLES|nr:hypothetical protein [Colocasia esculenta]